MKVNQLTDEVQSAKEQISTISKKLSRMQDALVIKDEENEKLSKRRRVPSKTLIRTNAIFDIHYLPSHKLVSEIGQLNMQLQKEQNRHEQVG